jgi:hypothetical protein
MATEWVPIQDTATGFPGSLWWDVKARERRPEEQAAHAALQSVAAGLNLTPEDFGVPDPEAKFRQTIAYRKNRALLEADRG